MVERDLRGFDGKVAIVSGGTKASGEAIAAELARSGASVVVCGRSATDGEAVADRIRSAGGIVCFLPADISREADVRGVVQETVTRCGRLDIVVNNAAALDVVRGGLGDAPVVDASTEAVERIMRVGFFGPFWFFKYGIPAMLRGGGGCFVSVSSTSAVSAVAGLPAYSASKAALEAMSRQVCADYGHAGIRANVVRLGTMLVPGNARLHADAAFHAGARAQVLVPRLGDPQDLANAVAFLASDRTSYATASVLTLDGGASVYSPSPSVSLTWGRQVTP